MTQFNQLNYYDFMSHQLNEIECNVLNDFKILVGLTIKLLDYSLNLMGTSIAVQVNFQHHRAHLRLNKMNKT